MACIEKAVRPGRLTYGNLSEFPARSGSRGGERGRQAVTVLAGVTEHLPASSSKRKKSVIGTKVSTLASAITLRSSPFDLASGPVPNPPVGKAHLRAQHLCASEDLARIAVLAEHRYPTPAEDGRSGRGSARARRN